MGWTAHDRQRSVDLGKQLRIPGTTLRPVIVLVSEISKQIVMLEVTMPWEERMEEDNERKKAKKEGIYGKVFWASLELAKDKPL